MNDSSDTIPVEVAYALPQQQVIITLDVERGCTAYEAVARSNIAEKFPGLDIETVPMGIFSQPLGIKGLPSARDYELQPGDRVELYRPLIADPKAVRKQRAEKARKKRQAEA